MKRKILIVAALLVAVSLIACVCWFANGLFGNPISKMLATNTAQNYIEETYPETDFELSHVSFDFKSTNYHAHIVSPSSIDSHFSLVIDMMGRIVLDLYENNVLTGWNTADRLATEYRQQVNRVLENDAFPYDCHIGLGELLFTPEEYKNEADVPSYAIVINELELDGVYDIHKLGAQAGKLTIYIEDDTVTVERLAQIILEIKGRFDDAGVPFHAMDCVLEYPKPERGEWNRDRVEVMEFPYEDIYEDGLVQRVQASNGAAVEYYNKMDGIKEEQMNTEP